MPPASVSNDDPRVQQSIRQQLHDSRAQLLQAAYREMLSDQAKVGELLRRAGLQAGRTVIQNEENEPQ